jgi:hypothetical protein
MDLFVRIDNVITVVSHFHIPLFDVVFDLSLKSKSRIEFKYTAMYWTPSYLRLMAIGK